jgi:hypothetical protein
MFRFSRPLGDDQELARKVAYNGSEYWVYCRVSRIRSKSRFRGRIDQWHRRAATWRSDPLSGNDYCGGYWRLGVKILLRYPATMFCFKIAKRQSPPANAARQRSKDMAITRRGRSSGCVGICSSSNAQSTSRNWNNTAGLAQFGFLSARASIAM